MVVGVVGRFTAVVEDSTVVAEAMRAVEEASPAEVIEAEDPHQCRDTAARLAEAVVIRAALLVVLHMHKVASVEAGRA